MTTDDIKGGDLARMAGVFCNDPQFRRWIKITFNPSHSVDTPAGAAVALRKVCQVNTRVELDHNAEKAEHFHRYIRRPFLHWKEGQEYLAAAKRRH